MSKSFDRNMSWLAALLALIAVGAPPAGADWLVTRDGARIETKGAWEVKGSQVIFTLPNGTLSALRKSEVDLDVSVTVTADSRKPAPSQDTSPVHRQSVLVLTNKDIRQANGANAERLTEEATGEDAASAAPERASPAVTRRGVEMVSWTSRDSGSVDGLEIVGTIKNTGSDIAANVGVKVTVIDQDGAPLLDTSAFLRSTGLAPGKSTTFRALLPGVFSLFQEPKFEISSGSVSVGGPATPEPEDDQDSTDDVDPSEIYEDAGG